MKRHTPGPSREGKRYAGACIYAYGKKYGYLI